AAFEGLGHVYECRVSQQCVCSVTAQLQPGNTCDRLKLARVVSGSLQPSEPRRLERHAIRPDSAGPESRLDNFFQRSRRKKCAREEIGMGKGIGRYPCGCCFAP